MTVKELLDAARLGEAIQAQTQVVRAKPTDTHARTALFELLCFHGDWDRAEKQLKALGGPDTDPKLQAGVQVFLDLIEAERKRSALFTSGVRPRFLLAPPPEVLARLDLLNAVLHNTLDEAGEALERVEAHHQAVAGAADGLAFDDIRDADDILAPVLEVFTRTGYFWLPFSQIQYLDVAPPATLRDLIWAPAKLAGFDGQLGEVYLPTLYPGTASLDDDTLKLGRGTDWTEALEGAIVRGRGRKLLLLGDEDRTIPDLRVVQFTSGAEAGNLAGSGDTPA